MLAALRVKCQGLQVILQISFHDNTAENTRHSQGRPVFYHQNPLLATSRPSHAIWNWLCCFSSFIKTSSTCFTLWVTSGRAASCLPPAPCPSQTDQCTAWRWQGRWGAAGPQCPSVGQRAQERWGRGPWQILRQTLARHSLGSWVYSRLKLECWRTEFWRRYRTSFHHTQ